MFTPAVEGQHADLHIRQDFAEKTVRSYNKCMNSSPCPTCVKVEWGEVEDSPPFLPPDMGGKARLCDSVPGLPDTILHRSCYYRKPTGRYWHGGGVKLSSTHLVLSATSSRRVRRKCTQSLPAPSVNTEGP